MGGSGADLPVVVIVVGDSNHFLGKEYVVNTATGKVTVTVCGDTEKPELIMYPHLGVNYLSRFQGLVSGPDAASLLYDNFCIYHIHHPVIRLACLVGASAISREEPVLTVGVLADQILEVLNYFKLDQVMCMGLTTGAYIIMLFAGLRPWFDPYFPIMQISISWPEWFYNKLTSHILHYSGISNMVKDILLKRYFSKEARGSVELPELGVVQAFRRLLGEKHACNIWRYLHAIDRYLFTTRHNLTRGLKSLTRPALIFVREHSPFILDAYHMSHILGKEQCTLVEVQACGSMVTEEEQQLAMQVPVENFLMRYGMYRPSLFNDSPRSVLNHCCISPNLSPHASEHGVEA